MIATVRHPDHRAADRGSPLDALIGWATSLLVGAAFWAAVIYLVGRTL